jgi:glycogen debranching enzyme
MSEPAEKKLTVDQQPAEQVPDFYIPATASILETSRRTLKQGNTFAIFDQNGDIMNAEATASGIFHDDTRYLSGSCLLIDGHRPLLLSSRLQDDNAALIVDLANPDIYRDEELVLSRETLHIVRTKFLWDSTADERILIQNFDLKPHRTRLMLSFAADFSDLFEVRGIKRARRGTTEIEILEPDKVLFRYRGLDNVERLTRIQFDPPPSFLARSHAIFDLEIEPQETKIVFSTIQVGTALRDGRGSFFSRMRAARHALRRETARSAVVSCSNTMMNEAMCRSVADLYMLISDTPQGPYPYAGIPWFSTPFGRDGIITALETLWLDPGIAKGVLRYLAATQAKKVDPLADAEPGKILHETRHGEMARLGEVPFALYYGSVDATPLFVLLAAKYFSRTGDAETIRRIMPAIDLALSWIDRYGDKDHDGFVEYYKMGEKGLANQGWKDSHDSIMHADGSLATGPIALCEVQGYVYCAKHEASAMFFVMGDIDRAQRLALEAEELRQRFEERFWSPEIGTYALALDGEKKRCAVRSSNAGHALFTGIASRERAKSVVQQLMNRRGFSGWGVRTLAEGEARFNPMSYHDGSVWPHDNALIALGFARYDFKQEASAVLSALFDTLHYMESLRLPELFCGFARRRGNAPTLYPVACSPQAWAAATPFALIQAVLGLEMDHAANEIRFNRPVLPEFIDEMCLKRLSLDGAQVDIRLERLGDDVSVNVLARSGDVRVLVLK